MESTLHMLTLWAIKTSRANKNDVDRAQIEREGDRHMQTDIQARGI